jgi:hypothetical protein
MYYHTLVANGPTRERIRKTLTGAIWIEGRHHPEVLTRRDLPVLLSRPVFLARKFQSDDGALLDDLEKIALSVDDTSLALSDSVSEVDARKSDVAAGRVKAAM